MVEAEEEVELVDVDKVRGDGPPYIVETQLPDTKTKMEGLQEDGRGRQTGLSVQG